MTKNAKRFISVVLALAMVFSLVIPAGATEAHTHADELVSALDGISVEALLENVKVDASDVELEVEYDAPLILADPNVEVNEDDPAIIGFETELKNIKVWDEAAQQPVPLTEEQIQSVLALYQQYLDFWDANTDTLGLQTPFFLSFNDKGEDGLGVLGEMLVLAGVPVDAVRAGAMTYDDLTGMILNFFYGDQLGVKYYGSAIEAARDEVMRAIEASGAVTEAQKLLVINDWLAHNNTFDMPYIMNSGKENPPMVAENPVKHEHYDDVLATMTEVYTQILTDTFKQQIVDGLEAEFKYQYYAGAIKEIMYQGGLAQASQDPDLIAAVKAQIGWEAAYAEALAAEEKKVYDAAYAEYQQNAHEHQVAVQITWTEQADGTFTASAAGACSVAGCTAELTIAEPVVTSTGTAATCTEAGVTTYTATVAGVEASVGTVAFTVANAEKSVEIAALGHNFVENVCTVCGETNGTLTPEEPGTPDPEAPETPEDPEIPEQGVEEEVPVLSAEGDEETPDAGEEPAPEADPADEYAKGVVAEKKADIEAAAAAAADETTGLQAAIDYAVTGGTEEADTEVELQVQQAAEDFVAANEEALRTDPAGFIDSQEMFQQMVPVTDANGNYIIGEDGQPVMMPLSQQLHMGWDAFWKDAQENGVEVDPVNAPGYKMTVDQIVEQQMNTPMEDLPQKEDGTHMTPNEAVPVFAAQAAAGLTDGIINYWEGSHFGALGFGTSVCLGYTKAFTYLVQCLHPEIYGVNGASTDMSVASNWKTRDQVYVYNEDGSIDINQNYVVDAVRITFDASVTMYGQTEDNFNNDHFWNAAKVDGQWYYFDPCYTDVFTEVMMRDRVETDGQMNHLYFMFSHNAAAQMYDGNFKEIKTLYETARRYLRGCMVLPCKEQHLFRRRLRLLHVRLYRHADHDGRVRK